jgi:hypothetical protein
MWTNSSFSTDVGPASFPTASTTKLSLPSHRRHSKSSIISEPFDGLNLTSVKTIALAYLARGADEGHANKFRTFVRSYQSFRPGIGHRLFVILKGFADSRHLTEGLEVFSSLEFTPIHTDDTSFDIGAYLESAKQIEAERICFLNTHSEIASHYWLAKLSNNLDLKNVGLVGATGSFESLNIIDQRIPLFPNVHIRSNALMIDRIRLVEILSANPIRTKMDTFFVESGPDSITRRVFQAGERALIVGRDGRGYHPQSWAQSFTFRQGDQSNLLIKDNVTRTFDEAPWNEKRELSAKSWGRYINSGVMELLPGAKY